MKAIVFVILVSLGATTTFAQTTYSSSGKSMAQLKREKERRAREERRKFSTDKLIFGGGFGLSLGAATSVAVSPILGYRITENFSAGVGFGYQFLRIKEYALYFNPATGVDEVKPLSATMFTPSIWTRYVIWNNIFAHAEYQRNYLTVKEYGNAPYYPNPLIQKTTKYNQDALWVGPGIRAPLTDRVSFVIMGLYNVIPDTKDILGNRLDIRLGVNVGF